VIVSSHSHFPATDATTRSRCPDTGTHAILNWALDAESKVAYYKWINGTVTITRLRNEFIRNTIDARISSTDL